MTIPIFNIDQTRHGLIMIITFRALDYIPNVINACNYRTCPALLAQFTVYRSRNVYITLHTALLRDRFKEVAEKTFFIVFLTKIILFSYKKGLI